MKFVNFWSDYLISEFWFLICKMDLMIQKEIKDYCEK